MIYLFLTLLSAVLIILDISFFPILFSYPLIPLCSLTLILVLSAHKVRNVAVILGFIVFNLRDILLLHNPVGVLALLFIFVPYIFDLFLPNLKSLGLRTFLFLIIVELFFINYLFIYSFKLALLQLILSSGLFLIIYPVVHSLISLRSKLKIKNDI